MNIKYLKPGIGMTTCWSLLGFKRGIDAYDYDYNKKITKDTYLFSSKFSWGLLGFVLYINPFSAITFIPKEIYRLEVNIRGIEHEKKSDYYNQLI